MHFAGAVAAAGIYWAGVVSNRLSFSVAMATYNGARHLRAQLDSIAAQALKPIELQIGDDGSTDATEAIVADFAASAPFPVNFHRNQPRLGYGGNFLEAARRCSGDWIAFSDQDDVWLPEKLAACAQALERAADPKILMIAHSAVIVGSDLTPTGGRIPEDLRDEVKGPLGHPLTWSHYGFAQLFRRELVADLPLAPRVPTVFTDIDPYPHDVWISALANVLGSTLHLARDLCLAHRDREDGDGRAGSRREGDRSRALPPCRRGLCRGRPGTRQPGSYCQGGMARTPEGGRGRLSPLFRGLDPARASL